MSEGQVRSRRTVLRGRGPVVDTLARILEAEADAPVLGDVDVVVVVDGGAFDPMPPARVGAWLEEHDAQIAREVAEFRPGSVHRVVVVSSATVLGTLAEGGAHTDDAVPENGIEGTAAMTAALEGHVVDAANALGIPVTVVRAAPVVGPGIDTMITRHFEMPWLLTLRGIDREWQFLHVDDLATAVRTVLDHDLGGTIVVGTPEPLSVREVVAASGMRRVDLPAQTAFGIAERLHRAGLLPASAADLSLVVHSWTVAPERLLALGWEPSRTNDDCLGELLVGVQGRTALVGRRVQGRDAAAFGAVGAAVAFLGTAAVMRQVRRR
ncbi:NAD-dependent epimerase/dehydratase family protein [Sanguibacter sp. A247]|uniref:NAD-dependent epimerase/dehydratase family protein n=1 Tax=unclassified Sanguibacter TaxID=2645534 RepID=UPI003FD703BE